MAYRSSDISSSPSRPSSNRSDVSDDMSRGRGQSENIRGVGDSVDDDEFEDVQDLDESEDQEDSDDI